MKFGSTSTNLNLLTIGTIIITVAGLWNTEMFTWVNIIIMLISFYILNILGVYMTLHRYYSHKSFEFNNDFLKWSFTILSILAGRGSPLGWVYLHRNHHAYSDTQKDPHSPKFVGFKFLSFKHFKTHETEKMKVFLVKDMMSQTHILIHKWYMIIIALFCFIFSIINLEMFYFMWVVPAFLIQLSQSSFNYIGHIYGYKNFTTSDNSKNNKYLFPVLLGEAWHNNHHANPLNSSTSHLKYEVDPLGQFINVIKK